MSSKIILRVASLNPLLIAGKFRGEIREGTQERAYNQSQSPINSGEIPRARMQQGEFTVIDVSIPY